jgi:hypothetical protein
VSSLVTSWKGLRLGSGIYDCFLALIILLSLFTAGSSCAFTLTSCHLSSCP